MSKLGYYDNVYLHLQTYNHFIDKLLPDNLSFIFRYIDENIYPHIIIQYNPQFVININDLSIFPSFSNRIIYTYDPYSKSVDINNHFFHNLYAAKAILISGFNAITDLSTFQSDIIKLRNNFSEKEYKSTVFYEISYFIIEILLLYYIKKLVNI